MCEVLTAPIGDLPLLLHEGLLRVMGPWGASRTPCAGTAAAVSHTGATTHARVPNFSTDCAGACVTNAVSCLISYPPYHRLATPLLTQTATNSGKRRPEFLHTAFPAKGSFNVTDTRTETALLLIIVAAKQLVDRCARRLRLGTRLCVVIHAVSITRRALRHPHKKLTNGLPTQHASLMAWTLHSTACLCSAKAH